MKHLLISTVGNRDVQFTRKQKESLPESFQYFLADNSETKDMMIISKSREDEWDFYRRSKELYHYYNEHNTSLEYPLIHHAIHHEGEPDKIILIATDQEPKFHLDTLYLGKILQSEIQKDLDKKVKLLTVKDALDASEIFELFQRLIQKNQNEHRITLHTSGGLPNFRISAFMSSLFKERVNVVNYVGKEARAASLYRDYEQHTLHQIVYGMLQNWNYSAILTLPLISDDVKHLCRLAIARLALDMDKARFLSSALSLNYPIPMENDQLAIEKELVYSAFVKYHQREYGDFLFRIFTFHDNVLVPHVEEILGGKIEYDPKSDHQSWKSLLRKKGNTDIYKYLKNATVGRTPLNFAMPNKEAYYRILHFCKKYSKTRKLTQKQFLVMNLYNKLSQLADLRNKIAHSYGGINESMILETASISDIKKITNKIDNYLNIKFDHIDPYEELNKMILDKV